MLEKKYRLRSLRDFRSLVKKGKSTGSKYLTIRYRHNKDQDYNRFAFIVSAKTEKKAVLRNRAKRQSRAIIRELLSGMRPGYDLALTMKASYLPLSYEEKKKQILYLLKKLSIL